MLRATLRWGPSLVLAVAVAACSQAHPQESDGCAPRTSLADFDAFAAALTEASLAATGEPTLPRATLETFARMRALVVDGTSALDLAAAATCLEHTRAGTAWTECGDVLHARCATPEGTVCGGSAVCDAASWCDTPGNGAACEWAGQCRARTAVGEPCAHNPYTTYKCMPSAGSASAECATTDSGEAICMNVSVQIAAAGSPCGSMRPSPAGPLVFIRCEPGYRCADDVCAPESPPGEHGQACDIANDYDCIAALYCDYSTDPPTCVRPEEIACTNELTSRERCPPPPAAHLPLACIDGACVVTDGARGAPCDPGEGGDCVYGLACGADGRCGDLLADGSACGRHSAECASGCCAGTLIPFEDHTCAPGE